jgi:adenylate kinase
MATYIVLIGPPGVGKGTQAKILSERTGLVHISSGDLFRENIRNEMELGVLAKSYIDRGALVPDDLTIRMVRERLGRADCRSGAILDGFPRTPAQAGELDCLLADLKQQVDAVPYIAAPEAVLVERVSGRWTCRAGGHIYHQKFHPPRRPGICDEDGSELYQREDDRVDTVRNRIHIYFEQTMPLVDYYRNKGNLIEIDGTRPVDLVTEDLVSRLKHLFG